jgi:hypothetical protein
VKLAEFNALCEREHERDGGIVTRLSLSPQDHAELSADVIGSLEPDGLVVRLPDGTAPTVTAVGAKVNEVVNPASRTPVSVTTAGLEGFTGRAEVIRWLDIQPGSQPGPCGAECDC